MKVAVTGPNGYVGKALVKAGCLPLCCDVFRPVEIETEINSKKPDIILHLAAKSDPDFCQKAENTFLVSNINYKGTVNVLLRAVHEKIPFVFMSSDQVWKGGFWEKEHRENDKNTPPVNFYGLTKLAAEMPVKSLFNEGAKIIRSSYIFDAHRLTPKLSKLKAGEEIYEPTFIKRSFIYLPDFVNLLLEYCKRIEEMPDVLHLAGSESVSWRDFMWEVAYQYGFDTELVRNRRNEEDGHAPRPHNGGLNTRLAQNLGFRVPHYTDGIKKMKNES